DAAIDETQPVVRIGAVGPLREAELQERRIEELAGIIASEGSAGAVRALHAGRETHDQQPRIEIAERTDGRVAPVGIFPLQLVAKRHEPGATRTVERR